MYLIIRTWNGSYKNLNIFSLYSDHVTVLRFSAKRLILLINSGAFFAKRFLYSFYSCCVNLSHFDPTLHRQYRTTKVDQQLPKYGYWGGRAHIKRAGAEWIIIKSRISSFFAIMYRSSLIYETFLFSIVLPVRSCAKRYIYYSCVMLLFSYQAFFV